jgi:hypothetical protein
LSEKEEFLREEAEKLYDRVVSKCIKSQRFPPKAVVSLIKHILERFDEWGVDPETFDWCAHLQGLDDYESIYDFIAHLEEEQLIPKKKSDIIDTLISQYERELAELGYVVVKKEEYDKILRSKNKDMIIRNLRRQISELRRAVKELQNELEAYKQGKVVPLTFYLALQNVMNRVKNIEQERIATSHLVETKRETVSMSISYELFLGNIRIVLERHNLPKPYIEMIFRDYESFWRELYDTIDRSKYRDVLYSILFYMEPVFRSNHEIFSETMLRLGNIEVRPPRPVPMWTARGRVVMSPPIPYIVPRFRDWASNYQGYTYNETLVPLEPKVTVIIHDPSKSEDLECLVYNHEGERLVVGCNYEVLAYHIDNVNRRITLFHYKPIKDVIEAVRG